MTTPTPGSPAVPRRHTAALLSALASGVTPAQGIEQMVVGRAAEVKALLGDLQTVAEGGAGFRMLSGPYGAGKSFLLALTRAQALGRNYAVMTADLSPERRLSGSGGQGLATYRELARNLATRVRPEGGAMGPLLERWISASQQTVIGSGMPSQDPGFDAAVEAEIHKTVAGMHGLVHGFDFAAVITRYWEGHRQGDEKLKTAALRWLRGEYSTRTEARTDLGVRVIIDDETWYDHLKLLATFVHTLGHPGLVVIIDEAVNLSKIVNPVSRQANYEKLLSMLNDTLQGNARHLMVLIGATPGLIENDQRGLYSYDALRTRLQQSRFARPGLTDTTGAVLRLPVLSSDEIYALLLILRGIHEAHHGVTARVDGAGLLAFMGELTGRLGAGEHLMPREVVRDFVSLLDLLAQNDTLSFGDLVRTLEVREEQKNSDETPEFASFDL